MKCVCVQVCVHTHIYTVTIPLPLKVLHQSSQNWWILLTWALYLMSQIIFEGLGEVKFFKKELEKLTAHILK